MRIAVRCFFKPHWRRQLATALAVAVFLAVGGVSLYSEAAAPGDSGTARFQFGVDTLAFANELAWSYDLDTVTGTTTKRAHVPRPEFTLRCFAVSRIAKQFFEHARFEPNEPKATRASYRHLIGLVKRRGTRGASPPESRLVIPGYANLREFSQENESLLKAESGPAWRSFVQRGNWRMVFPFSRRHQQRTAERLLESLAHGGVPAVHVVNFPALALNHAVLVYDAAHHETEIAFAAYDPNDPEKPVQLVYSRSERRFHYPRTRYFAGGPVNLYQIFRGIGY
ncbi:MAG: hypothetical protein AB9869_03150 [Verrucomicrobiia bacterium]